MCTCREKASDFKKALIYLDNNLHNYFFCVLPLLYTLVVAAVSHRSGRVLTLHFWEIISQKWLCHHSIKPSISFE